MDDYRPIQQKEFSRDFVDTNDTENFEVESMRMESLGLKLHYILFHRFL